MATPSSRGKLLDRALIVAQLRPAHVVAWVLGLHVAVWTALPLLVCWNLQLDLVEALALGKEWQLGYWKHPPLPWWIADLAYRLTGDVRAVYLLGPLATAACLYAVWRFARSVTDERRALVAMLALEGLHFFNFSAVKFNHDVIQLPFWVLAAWCFHRAVTAGKARDWVLSGGFLALAFWSKYAGFALGATLGLILLLDPLARRAWRTPGPYLMAAAFLLVLSPNLWWLVASDFQPLRHVEARSEVAAHWYQFISFPILWTVSQAAFLAPVIALVALAYLGAARKPADGAAADRRLVAALAFGPFVVTTVIAAVLGRMPVSTWGYPLWTLAPLASVMWLGPLGSRGLRRFAIGFLVVFVAFPAAYAASELFEPFLRDRSKATQFPGRLLAETVTRDWRARTGAPLHYVGGVDFGSSGVGEFAANNVAVYSPDHPHVVMHADIRISPWVDRADLERRGAVFVWQQASDVAALPEPLRASFPRAELRPVLVLPRQTLNPRVRPEHIGVAILPPQPAAPSP